MRHRYGANSPYWTIGTGMGSQTPLFCAPEGKASLSDPQAAEEKQNGLSTQHRRCTTVFVFCILLCVLRISVCGSRVLDFASRLPVIGVLFTVSCFRSLRMGVWNLVVVSWGQDVAYRTTFVVVWN